jgi:tryptophanyl-tRNA synthetase
LSTNTVFSAIQPSGSLTLGNYLGAIRTWVELQAQEDCIYSLADLHALTAAPDPQALRTRCIDTFCLCWACGVDPARSILFLQSHVPAHAELAWLLASFTHVGELGRMTQYKEKVLRNEKSINVGLFTYPVLMAADILLYGAALVPVGEDQRQHVELAREIALRFNRKYGPVFTIPEPLIGKTTARLRSLADPNKKMSKTDPNPRGYIALLDSPDVVRSKIRAAVTGGGKGYRERDGSPGIDNLVSIMAAVRGVEVSEVVSMHEGRGYKEFKDEVADALIEFLAPVQSAYGQIRQDEGTFRLIFSEGAARARNRASVTLARAYNAVGLVSSVGSVLNP